MKVKISWILNIDTDFTIMMNRTNIITTSGHEDWIKFLMMNDKDNDGLE